MIIGRTYILQSRRGGKAYKPASNVSGALLKAYTRPSDGLNDYAFVLEGENNEFRFKHVTTGLYLTANGTSLGAKVQLSALSGNGTNLQRWTLEGNDDNVRISTVQSAGALQITLTADSEGTDASLQPYSGLDTNSDERVIFSEYSPTPSGVTAPSLNRVFSNFTSITVTNVIAGATVIVSVDGAVRQTVTNASAGSQSVYLGTLSVGQRITATQTVGTTVSASSETEYVQEVARVWKEGTVDNISYRAYKVVVTGITNQDDISTVTGTKGEPLASSRSTVDLALADITAAGLTETVFISSVFLKL